MSVSSAARAPQSDTGTGKDTVSIRPATPSDGAEMWRLVKEGVGLDENSSYAYLLLCKLFSATCLAARRRGELVGFVIGFRPPERPQAVFVWQIGVAPQCRGQGLASRLLDALVERPSCADVRYLEASVTPDNTASRALFQGFARRHGVACEVSPFLDAELFPDGHEAEELFTIGPLAADRESPTRSCA